MRSKRGSLSGLETPTLIATCWVIRATEIVLRSPSIRSSVREGGFRGFSFVKLPDEFRSLRRYRVTVPLLVLAIRSNHQAAVTIQARKIFEVVGPTQDDRFVVVEAKGEQFLVFDCDLNDRSKFVPHKQARIAVHAAGLDGDNSQVVETKGENLCEFRKL